MPATFSGALTSEKPFQGFVLESSSDEGDFSSVMSVYGLKG
jgi:hypothetical protein